MISRHSTMYAKNLLSSQADFGGSGACTVAACAIGLRALKEPRFASSDALLLRAIEDELRRGCELWLALKCGFLTPSQALAQIPELQAELAIESEHFTDAKFNLSSEELELPSAATVLREWDSSSQLDTSFCVLVRDQYSFLIVRSGIHYLCIDTHEGALQRRRSAIVENLCIQNDTEKATKGLLLKSLFLQDVLLFVENYCGYQPTMDSTKLVSSNQVDICILKRREQ